MGYIQVHITFDQICCLHIYISHYLAFFENPIQIIIPSPVVVS